MTDWAPLISLFVALCVIGHFAEKGFIERHVAVLNEMREAARQRQEIIDRLHNIERHTLRAIPPGEVGDDWLARFAAGDPTAE